MKLHAPASLPLATPSHIRLLSFLDAAGDDDNDFVSRLSRVSQWRSDGLADLGHFRGVLRRVDKILRKLLQVEPCIVVDGGQVRDPEALAAASETAHACLRFLALLVRVSANRRAFASLDLVIAFLAARVGPVVDAALNVAASLLEPATFYLAREEEAVHDEAERSAQLNARLAILAQTWAGVSNCSARNPAWNVHSTGVPRNRMRTSDGGSSKPTSTLIEVATLDDDRLANDGCAVWLEFVHVESTTALASSAASTPLPPHVVSVSSVVPAVGDTPFSYLFVSDVRDVAAALTAQGVQPTSWRVADVIGDAAGVPPESRFMLLARVRNALEFKGSPDGGRASRIRGLWRQSLAMASCLRCVHSPSTIQCLFGDGDSRYGADIAELATRGGSLTLVPADMSPDAGGAPETPLRRTAAAAAVAAALAPRSLESVALAALAALSVVTISDAPGGDDAGAAGATSDEQLAPTTAAAAAVCGVPTGSSAATATAGSAVRATIDGVAAPLPPEPYAPLLHLLHGAFAVTRDNAAVAGIGASPPTWTFTTLSDEMQSAVQAAAPEWEWFVPAALECAAAAVRFVGAQLPSIPADRIPPLVEAFVAIVTSDGAGRGHATVVTAAASALSVAVSPDSPNAGVIGSALRSSGALEALCRVLARATDEHIRCAMLAVRLETGANSRRGTVELPSIPQAPPPSTKLTLPPQAGIDLDFALGPAALATSPDSSAVARAVPAKDWRRVLPPFPEYRRELFAVIFDALSDALQPGESAAVADVSSAAESGAALLRPLVMPLEVPPATSAVSQMSESSRDIAQPLRSFALGRPMSPDDEFSEHNATDAPLTWAIKDILSYPAAFGGSLIHIASALVTDIVHADPGSCTVAFDVGITPMYMRLVLQRSLPPNTQALAVLPTVVPELLLTETSRERIGAFARAALVPARPIGSAPPPAWVASPALRGSTMSWPSPALTSVAHDAASITLGASRRRSSSLIDDGTFAAGEAAAAARRSSLGVSSDADDVAARQRTPMLRGTVGVAASSSSSSMGGAPPPPLAVTAFETALVSGNRSFAAFTLFDVALLTTAHAQAPNFRPQPWITAMNSLGGNSAPGRAVADCVIGALMVAMADYIALGAVPGLLDPMHPASLCSPSAPTPEMILSELPADLRFEVDFCESSHPLAAGVRHVAGAMLACNSDLTEAGAPHPRVLDALGGIPSPRWKRFARAELLSQAVDAAAAPPRTTSSKARFGLAPATPALPQPIPTAPTRVALYDGPLAVDPRDICSVVTLRSSASRTWFEPDIAGSACAALSMAVSELRAGVSGALPSAPANEFQQRPSQPYYMDAATILPADRASVAAAPIDAFFSCPWWDGDDSSGIADHVRRVDSRGGVAAPLDRAAVTDIARRIADAFSSLPQSRDSYIDALRSRIERGAVTLAELRDEYAYTVDALQRGAESKLALLSGDALESEREHAKGEAEAILARALAGLDTAYRCRTAHIGAGLANVLTVLRTLCKLRRDNDGDAGSLRGRDLSQRMLHLVPFCDAREWDRCSNLKYPQPWWRDQCTESQEYRLMDRWFSVVRHGIDNRSHVSSHAKAEGDQSVWPRSRSGTGARALLASATTTPELLVAVEALLAPTVWTLVAEALSASTLTQNDSVSVTPPSRRNLFSSAADELRALWCQADPVHARLLPAGKWCNAMMAVLAMPVGSAHLRCTGYEYAVAQAFCDMWHMRADAANDQPPTLGDDALLTVAPAIIDAASRTGPRIGTSFNDAIAIHRASTGLLAHGANVAALTMLPIVVADFVAGCESATAATAQQIQHCRRHESSLTPSDRALYCWAWTAAWQSTAVDHWMLSHESRITEGDSGDATEHAAALSYRDSFVVSLARVAASALWAVHSVPLAMEAENPTPAQGVTIVAAQPPVLRAMLDVVSAVPRILAVVLTTVGSTLVLLPKVVRPSPHGQVDGKVNAASLPHSVCASQLTPWADVVAYGVAAALRVVLQKWRVAPAPRMDLNVVVGAAVAADALRIVLLSLVGSRASTEELVALIQIGAGSERAARNTVARVQADRGFSLNTAVLYAATRAGTIAAAAQAAAFLLDASVSASVALSTTCRDTLSVSDHPALSNIDALRIQGVVARAAEPLGLFLSRIANEAYFTSSGYSVAMVRQAGRLSRAADVLHASILKAESDNATTSEQYGMDAPPRRSLARVGISMPFRPADLALATVYTFADALAAVTKLDHFNLLPHAVLSGILAVSVRAARLHINRAGRSSAGVSEDSFDIAAARSVAAHSLPLADRGDADAWVSAARSSNVNFNPFLPHVYNIQTSIIPDVLIAGRLLRPLPLVHVTVPNEPLTGVGDGYAPTIAQGSIDRDVTCVQCHAVISGELCDKAMFSVIALDNDHAICAACNTLLVCHDPPQTAPVAAQKTFSDVPMGYQPSSLGGARQEPVSSTDASGTESAASQLGRLQAYVAGFERHIAGAPLQSETSDEVTIAQITEMGFPRARAIRALRAAGGLGAPEWRRDRVAGEAVTMLLSGSFDDDDEEHDEGRERSVETGNTTTQGNATGSSSRVAVAEAAATTMTAASVAEAAVTPASATGLDDGSKPYTLWSPEARAVMRGIRGRPKLPFACTESAHLDLSQIVVPRMATDGTVEGLLSSCMNRDAMIRISCNSLLPLIILRLASSLADASKPDGAGGAVSCTEMPNADKARVLVPRLLSTATERRTVASCAALCATLAQLMRASSRNGSSAYEQAPLLFSVLDHIATPPGVLNSAGLLASPARVASILLRDGAATAAAVHSFVEMVVASAERAISHDAALNIMHLLRLPANVARELHAAVRDVVSNGATRNVSGSVPHDLPSLVDMLCAARSLQAAAGARLARAVAILARRHGLKLTNTSAAIAYTSPPVAGVTEGAPLAARLLDAVREAVGDAACGFGDAVDALQLISSTITFYARLAAQADSAVDVVPLLRIAASLLKSHFPLSCVLAGREAVLAFAAAAAQSLPSNEPPVPLRDGRTRLQAHASEAAAGIALSLVAKDLCWATAHDITVLRRRFQLAFARVVNERVDSDRTAARKVPSAALPSRPPQDHAQWAALLRSTATQLKHVGAPSGRPLMVPPTMTLDEAAITLLGDDRGSDDSAPLFHPLCLVAFSAGIRLAPSERWIGSVPTVELIINETVAASREKVLLRAIVADATSDSPDVAAMPSATSDVSKVREISANIGALARAGDLHDIMRTVLRKWASASGTSLARCARDILLRAEGPRASRATRKEAQFALRIAKLASIGRNDPPWTAHLHSLAGHATQQLAAALHASLPPPRLNSLELFVDLVATRLVDTHAELLGPTPPFLLPPGDKKRAAIFGPAHALRALTDAIQIGGSVAVAALLGSSLPSFCAHPSVRATTGAARDTALPQGTRDVSFDFAPTAERAAPLLDYLLLRVQPDMVYIPLPRDGKSTAEPTSLFAVDEGRDGELAAMAAAVAALPYSPSVTAARVGGEPMATAARNGSAGTPHPSTPPPTLLMEYKSALGAAAGSELIALFRASIAALPPSSTLIDVVFRRIVCALTVASQRVDPHGNERNRRSAAAFGDESRRLAALASYPPLIASICEVAVEAQMRSDEELKLLAKRRSLKGATAEAEARVVARRRVLVRMSLHGVGMALVAAQHSVDLRSRFAARTSSLLLRAIHGFLRPDVQQQVSRAVGEYAAARSEVEAAAAAARHTLSLQAAIMNEVMLGLTKRLGRSSALREDRVGAGSGTEATDDGHASTAKRATGGSSAFPVVVRDLGELLLSSASCATAQHRDIVLQQKIVADWRDRVLASPKLSELWVDFLCVRGSQLGGLMIEAPILTAVSTSGVDTGKPTPGAAEDSSAARQGAARASVPASATAPAEQAEHTLTLLLRSGQLPLSPAFIPQLPSPSSSVDPASNSGAVSSSSMVAQELLLLLQAHLRDTTALMAEFDARDDVRAVRVAQGLALSTAASGYIGKDVATAAKGVPRGSAGAAAPPAPTRVVGGKRRRAATEPVVTMLSASDATSSASASNRQLVTSAETAQTTAAATTSATLAEITLETPNDVAVGAGAAPTGSPPRHSALGSDGYSSSGATTPTQRARRRRSGSYSGGGINDYDDGARQRSRRNGLTGAAGSIASMVLGAAAAGGGGAEVSGVGTGAGGSSTLEIAITGDSADIPGIIAHVMNRLASHARTDGSQVHVTAELTGDSAASNRDGAEDQSHEGAGDGASGADDGSDGGAGHVMDDDDDDEIDLSGDDDDDDDGDNESNLEL